MKGGGDMCVSELQGMEADLQLTIKLTTEHTRAIGWDSSTILLGKQYLQHTPDASTGLVPI